MNLNYFNYSNSSFGTRRKLFGGIFMLHNIFNVKIYIQMNVAWKSRMTITMFMLNKPNPY